MVLADSQLVAWGEKVTRNVEAIAVLQAAAAEIAASAALVVVTSKLLDLRYVVLAAHQAAGAP